MRKIYLAIGLSILAVIIGLLLYNSDLSIVFKIIGIGIVLFGLSGLFFSIKSVIGPQIGLVMDEIGIHDTSTPTALGLIKWEEIAHIDSIDIKGTIFLLIQVVNPEQYLTRAKYFSKKSLKLGIKKHGTPVIISAHSLKCNLDELEDILYANLMKYREQEKNQ